MNPVAGGMCIAPYESMWYRARIRTVLGDRVRVFYVDYGNTETVRISEIRELLPEFREVEFMVSLTFKLTFKLCDIPKSSKVVPLMFLYGTLIPP